MPNTKRDRNEPDYKRGCTFALNPEVTTTVMVQLIADEVEQEDWGYTTNWLVGALDGLVKKAKKEERDRLKRHSREKEEV